MTNRRTTTFFSRPHRQRGFTLIESLMAAGVLLIIVTAVGLAVTSGQQHAYFARERISATLAADELMCRLQAVSYDDLYTKWHGHEEQPGEMVDAKGRPLPPSFANVGRRVEVEAPANLSPVGTTSVAGRVVVVQAFDSQYRPLAELRRFVPAPIIALVEDDDD